MLSASPRAKLFVEGPGSARTGSFSVGGESRAGLALHPAASIVFPTVRVATESLLKFRIGVAEADWNQPGDGVEFVVFVQGANDARSKIFSRYIDPKHNVQDRRWIEEAVPLRLFADQDVRVTLSTEPGPANDFTADTAVWAEPQIVLRSEPDQHL